MEQRLQPVEMFDFSKGLNNYSAPSLTGEFLTTSRNMRHKGPGRLTRRNGMKKIVATGLQPTLGTNYPVGVANQTGLGRLIIPYLLRLNENGKRTVASFIASIANNLFYFRDDGTIIYMHLRDATYGVQAHLAWRPRYASAGVYYENFGDVGAGFMDDRIFIGTSLEYGTEMFSSSTEYSFPYGCYVRVSNSSTLAVGGTVTGATSGASGKIGYKGPSATDRLYLYNWNGINFQEGESIGGGLVVETEGGFNGRQYGLAGCVLEYNSGESKWVARKWGIDKPIAALTAADGAAGLVEAGTYEVKYTFIRYSGGALSAGDNQKLSGGVLVSESAPSPALSFVAAGSKKISYTGFDVPADPQITHIRVYRTDGATDVFHHACDIPISESQPCAETDNLAVLDIQAELVLLDTDNYKTFGEAGENSGFAIEVADRRVFVGGNKSYPQRLYFSDLRIEQKCSEYFSSSLDFAESPGESITAIKYWGGKLFVFMERSVYQVDWSLTGDATQVSKVQTRGVGCVARNGILDMGNYLLVMSERGLLRFDGTSFDDIPVTLPISDSLGTSLLNAVMTRSNDNIYIITDTSRAANQIIVIKFSDGSFACSLDVLDTNTSVPDTIAFLPNLKNFGNTTDDSNCVVGLSRSVNSSVLYYYPIKYDLAGQSYDLHLVDASASISYPIVAQFSPRFFDFGGFSRASLERAIAYIASSGDEDSSNEAPNGEFLLRAYVNYAENGLSELYGEAKFMLEIMRNKVLTSGNGDPIQTKFTKPFASGYQHQTGGVMGDDSPATVILGLKKMLYEATLDPMWGRLWRLVFEYSSVNNFEFCGFSFKFIRKEDG